MIPQTFETESTSSYYAKSETESMPETESSVSSNPQDGGRSEPKKKLKGLRSMRLLRLSSVRSSIKGPKSRYENIDSQSSERPSSVEMSDASPNYMKATSSSHAKESFQGSERIFTRKNLTRIPTLKLRRNLTRKLSGGTELKRKLKPSRSIKHTSVKGLRSSRQGTNQDKASTFNDRQNSKHPSENSQRVMTRRLSFKPVRILSNRYVFRSRKVSKEESLQILQSSDSSLHKATCSSTLKDSHFPDQIELPLEEHESQEVLLTRKVCPYTYCSLHGGHHGNMPPLKRFASMRRRQLKTHKNTKMEIQPVTRSKHSGNKKKGNQTSQSICSENPENTTAPSRKPHNQNDKKPARDFPVKTPNALASSFNGGGSSGGDNKENINFRCNAKVLPGETSFPHKTFDQYLNDSLAENGYNLSSFLAIKESNLECCRTVTYEDKRDSEVIETARNTSIVAARDKYDESTQSVLMDDGTDILNSELMVLQDPDLCDKHSGLIDDSVVVGHEVLGVVASPEKREERNSILELADPESSGESINAHEFRSARDQSDKLKASDQNDVVELTSTPAATCTATKIHTLEEEITAKDKNIDSHYDILQDPSPPRESNPTSTTDASYRIPEGDKKYIKMWHLIYKHAVLSNAEKEDKLQSDQEDKEAQGKDGFSSNGVNNSSLQDTDDENENVVELVQKAFDEILLPEMEDISSDNHLESQGMASDEELLDQSQGKERDRSTSTSTDSPQEEATLKLDDEEEKASEKMEDKPEPKTPKSWSSLKKLLLLKRFVKALDKVRKINFLKPKHLPSDANPKVEKVYLRHLIPGEGKNVEEWMLDYALQKVISKLGPAQKQRVTLLVEAFETVLPFQDIENGPLSSATIENQASATQGPDSSDHGEEITDREREYDVSAKLLLGKAFHSHRTFKEHADDASDNPMTEQYGSDVVEEAKNNPRSRAIDGDWIGKQIMAGNHDKEENNTIVDDNVYPAGTKDSTSLFSGTPVDTTSTSLEEDQADEMVNGVSQNMISCLTTEIPSGESESHGRDFENENLISTSREPLSMSKSLILKGFVRSLGSSLVSSAAPSDQLDEPVAGRKESIVKAKPEIENLEQFPPADGTTILQEKQNHTGLWYLVYRRMASGVATNDFKPLVDGDDENEQGYDNSRITGSDTSISHGSIPVANQDIPLEDHPVTDSEVELRQLEAIKIVEEAIDAILPEAQEHSHDGQQVADSNISVNSIQSHRVEGVNSRDLYRKEDRVTSDNGMTQEQDEEPTLKEGNKPLSRNWSNLKKVIMLRRFIKALEKVRKINPQGPRYLPVEPDPEGEKVNLRHQDMGERKGSAEWMLDHALRQVVAKLTPARKKKVELLVEAFETVMPTIKN